MVLAWSVALAMPFDDVPNPRTQNGWVSDTVGVIEATPLGELNQRLTALEQSTGAEVAVVIVADTDELTPKMYATSLFNHWGLGKKNANNGVLVLLAMDSRRLEMETGYGVEGVLTDSWLGGMQRQTMVPAFKAGDFGGGLVAGVGAIATRLDENASEVREGTRGAIPVSGSPGSTGVLGMSATTLAGVGALGTSGMLGVGVLGVVGRRRYVENRTCPTCRIPMPMLSEAADDAHLDPGQIREEEIQSVDWQVHACPQCEHTRTFRVGRWFSGYSQCPSCNYQTRSTEKTTLRHATRYSGGRVRVNESCANCSFKKTYTYATARLPKPSSSSSGGSFGGGGGGGGSFGGGSSGGGGAGSSW